MRRTMLFASLSLLAPVLGAASSSVPSTAVNRVDQPAERLSWRRNPRATGALAVRSDDRLVTGRIATASANQVVVESDLGGNETLTLSPGTPFKSGARLIHRRELHSGEVVSASYHRTAAGRRADEIAVGDVDAGSLLPAPRAAAWANMAEPHS